MADASKIPDEAEPRALQRAFAWTDMTAVLGAMDIVFGECAR